LSLYPARSQAICKQPDFPKWKTWPFQLIDPLIDAAISAETDQYWGCKLTPHTRFFVLDLDNKPDRQSKYRNPHGLKAIRNALQEVGISHVCCYQSSLSGGWHLYGFFDDWVNSDELRDLLKAWLQHKDFQIDQATLEIFPSNQGLRLPLQKGFAWLDDTGGIVQTRETLTTDQALRRFLCDLEANANNWPMAKRLIESQLDAGAAAAGGDAQEHLKAISGEGFDDLFNARIIRENYEKGQKYWQTGLTHKNQRHAAVICIEHYLWHGDQAAGLPAYPGRFNDQRRYRLIRAWLEQNHNSFCNHINAGEWQTVEAQIRRACEWRRDEKTPAPEREPYPLTERLQEVLIVRSMATGRTWTVDDLIKGNEGREKDARKKIKAAVRKCLTEGRQISRKTLQALSGCSPNTLRKHADLWRLLAAGSGDKNRGVQGGLSVLPGSSGPERDFLIRPLVGDSGDLGVMREAVAEVAPPLLSCLAGEPTTYTQHQDQALRVPSEVLTPGPVLRGIQAVLQEGAGGGFSYAAAGPVKLCLFVPGSVRLQNDKQAGGCSSPPGTQSLRNKAWCGIISGQAGLMAVTTCHRPVNPCAAVIAVHRDSVSNSGFIRTAHVPQSVVDIRRTRLQSLPLRLFVYGDVRGPPICTRLI